MKLSDSQADSMIRRELQGLTSQWHSAPPPVTHHAPRSWRTTTLPFAAALSLAVVAGSVGLAVHWRGSSVDQAGARGTQSPPASVVDAESPPLGRVGTAMSWDASRHSAVLVGTPAGQSLTQTWLWTAPAQTAAVSGGWSQLRGGVQPPFCTRPTMAEDMIAARLVWFCASASPGVAQTWTFDGHSWAAAASVSRGGDAVMAWDEGRGSLVLVVEPAGAGPARPGHTWAWAGGAWHDLGQAPALTGVRATHSTQLKALLLAGGDATGAVVTYQLAGSSWRPVDMLPREALHIQDPGTDVAVGDDPVTGDIIAFDAAIGPQAPVWIRHLGAWGGSGRYFCPAPAGGMLVDADRGELLLFAGSEPSHPFSRVYKWTFPRGWVSLGYQPE